MANPISWSARPYPSCSRRRLMRVQKLAVHEVGGFLTPVLDPSCVAQRPSSGKVLARLRHSNGLPVHTGLRNRKKGEGNRGRIQDRVKILTPVGRVVAPGVNPGCGVGGCSSSMCGALGPTGRSRARKTIPHPGEASISGRARTVQNLASCPGNLDR